MAALVAAVAAGCVSVDSLLPGQSTEADAVAQLGPPVQRLTRADGSSALYFSRLPEGRAVYVVTLGPDGVMLSVEQRLVRANLRHVLAGTSTMDDVRALFGPPGNQGRLERQKRTWWEYKYVDYDLRRVFWVQFSDDGVVREVLDSADWEREDICSPSSA